MADHILTINGGSSSVKFAVFTAAAAPQAVFRGAVKRIGLPKATITIRDATDKVIDDRTLEVTDVRAAAGHLIDWLEGRVDLSSVAAAGHRVVHGGPNYTEPTPITPKLLNELRRLASLDIDHMPGEIELIEAVTARCPKVPQVACFDTAFHRDLPVVAKLLPTPRKYEAAGIRRYGFHGLSYTYLMEELARQTGSEAACGRVILAHLGAGASMAAVHGGRCVDTTMAFTPTAGLMMGTRTGDLDPGVLVYLLRTENLSADAMDELVNRQSGLLGVSGVSSDLRDLIAQQSTNRLASEAVALFCYQARKWIGALAAALGGVDTLVFSGGIGENSAEVRRRICESLEHLGIRLDEQRNSAGASTISTKSAAVAVRVIATDEEIVIARAVHRAVQVR